MERVKVEDKENVSYKLQLLTYDYTRLLDKLYVKWVTLREQNLSSKCCSLLSSNFVNNRVKIFQKRYFGSL